MNEVQIMPNTSHKTSISRRWTWWLILLPLLFVAWIILGHKGSVRFRLEQDHILRPGADFRLIHSSGYLRENWHLIECANEDVLAGQPGGLPLDKLTGEKELHDETAIHLFRLRKAHFLKFPPELISWEDDPMYSGMLEVVLGTVEVVKTSKGRAFVYLNVF
jgi:hypothetical protein